MDDQGGPLPVDSAVLDSLLLKHPRKRDPSPSALIGDSTDVQPPHPILFDQLYAFCIRRAALHTSGAAGPSGLDAAAWHRMYTSFHRVSDDLCDALSAVARKLCTSFVDPSGLSAFVCCCLIALDKRPGVRPIGIGETVRRITAKAVLSVIKEDIRETTGSLQLCAGHLSGCEAAVHSVQKMFASVDCEAAVLVDATNALIL